MKLEGSKIVVTGEFDGCTVEQARERLREAGAIVVDAVAPDVDYVFAGEGAGTEVDDAMEVGVRVRESRDLRALMEGRAAPPPAPEPEVPPEAFDTLEGPPPGLADSLQPAPPAPASPRDEVSGERVMEKGARVRIVGGVEGIGVIGEIFWWGESKFGDGMRAGISDDAGEKYWVDAEHLAWPEEEIPDDVLETARKAAEFRRGDRVKIVSGKGAGSEGEIFWWGESKWGNGMRAGVETDDGEKVWADADALEPIDSEDDIPF